MKIDKNDCSLIYGIEFNLKVKTGGNKNLVIECLTFM